MTPGFSAVCLALSASPRWVPLRTLPRVFSGSLSMSASPTAKQWPTPGEFNALPLSSRTKIYSDYGDAGKMTWVPHEEPPKV